MYLVNLAGPTGLAGFTLLFWGVLGASTCARPRSTNRPVRYAHSSPVLVLSKLNQEKRTSFADPFFLAGHSFTSLELFCWE